MTPGRMAAFLGMGLVLWTLLHVYVALRLFVRAGLGRRAKTAAWTALATTWLLMPVSIFLIGGPTPPGAVAWALAWGGYAAMGVIAIVFPYTLARDLLWLGAFSFRLLPRDPGRRAAALNASSAAVAAAAGLTALAALVIGALPPRVAVVNLEVRNLPASLDGFTIAFASDLHIGAVGSRRVVDQLVARVNELHPDVFVLAGDVGDGMVSALGDQIAALRDIRARDGRFFVTGNHDYFRDPAAWLAKVRSLGFTVLENRNRIIRCGGSRVVIAGIPDYQTSSWFGIPSDPGAAIRGAPPGGVRILVSHNPVAAAEAAGCGYDFQLSGHSHGGQFFPWTLVFGNLPWYHVGFHAAGKMRLYVSPGAGSWGPPMRLGSRKEINLFRLTRAKPV